MTTLTDKTVTFQSRCDRRIIKLRQQVELLNRITDPKKYEAKKSQLNHEIKNLIINIKTEIRVTDTKLRSLVNKQLSHGERYKSLKFHNLMLVKYKSRLEILSKHIGEVAA